ncbi:MAG: 3-hydroxyacyl-CoA dehydrogenase/enoyl-CoA hydratase/3-hydroxybutyryl-CoA epimerase [Rickettsiales bacterium]|jgi:3-hydroxyacyl-CoA dehydrogenase/enoyl-CoA hydratase/3-hydroxybutyryl-CoA epimerase
MSESLLLQIDSNGIATLVFNLKNEKINKLRSDVLLELESILDQIKSDKNIHLLLIKSDKKNIFIAGADIGEIKDIKTPSDAHKKVLQGQEILNKISNLKIPTISLINGACLGGGLELALACNYRVAVDNKKTILGLPEVNLGIIPGFGGTQRLPRLIGLQESLKMILSGKPVDYKKAFKIGLVDKVIREEFLPSQIENFIAAVLVKKRSNQSFKNRCIIRKKRFITEVIFAGKHVIYYLTKKSLIAKTKGKYPAPLAAFDVIKRTYHSSDKAAGLKIEAEEFAKLASGSVSKNLIELFFINEEIKKDSGSKKDVKILEIKKAGLLGAGIMGGGIAWLFSNANICVRMKDISQNGIALGFHQILKIYNQLKKIRKYKQNQIDLKIANVSSSIDYSGFDNVDIVVEAIVENLEVKKESFEKLEKYVREDTIIVSNTSSLSISEMSSSLENPERFAGMHFFNPVNKMPLVEVIRGEKTSDETIAAIVDLSKKLKKTPIVVKDVAGFLVNRILLPYINEAGFLLQEGTDLRNIDQLIGDFGMPMGPFILADTVGIDVGYKVAKSLSEAYGKRMDVCQLLTEMSKRKSLLGKKSGQGFYRYNKNGKNLGINFEINNILGKIKDSQNSKTHVGNTTITDRCILIMVNEAARCLEEEVVKNHRYLDMAIIMGTGFPAFRGGLLKYADDVGIGVIVTKLKEFSTKYGPRFEPAELLLKMESENRNFY